MTKISIELPDTLYRRAMALAERERISLDHFIALAVANQIASWEVVNGLKEMAAKGNWDDVRKILAKAQDIEPAEEDRLN